MSLIESVPDWFEWHDASPFLAVGHAHKQLMERCLNEWIGVNAPEEVRRLFDDFHDADPGRLARLVLAPQTFHSLYGGLPCEAGAGTFLEDALAAEHCLRVGAVPDLVAGKKSQYWTALGDYCALGSSGGIIAHGRECGHLFLDGTSIYSRFDHDLGGDQAVAYGQAGLQDALARTEDAVCRLGRCGHPVETFLTASLRSVVLQECPSVRRFFSGSRCSYLGMAGLVNAHLANAHDLMDALVHEAVHGLMYTLELFEPFYTGPDARTAMTVTSPWSGRPLPLHSYTHACFVWYALSCFWLRFHEGSPEAGRKGQRAFHGFMSSDLTEPMRGHVTRDVVRAVACMQDRVRRASR